MMTAGSNARYTRRCVYDVDIDCIFLVLHESMRIECGLMSFKCETAFRTQKLKQSAVTHSRLSGITIMYVYYYSCKLSSTNPTIGFAAP